MSGSTKRTIIVAVPLMLIAIGVFGGMVYQVNALGQELREQMIKLDEQSAQEESYYKLLRLSEETVGEREQLRHYFLRRESDSIDFLNHVESIAPAAGVVIDAQLTSLDTIKEKDGVTSWVTASFNFSGTRHNVQNFIQILETLPYVQRLTSVEMGIRSSTVWQASVTMQVRVLAYEE